MGPREPFIIMCKTIAKPENFTAQTKLPVPCGQRVVASVCAPCIDQHQQFREQTAQVVQNTTALSLPSYDTCSDTQTQCTYTFLLKYQGLNLLVGAIVTSIPTHFLSKSPSYFFTGLKNVAE